MNGTMESMINDKIHPYRFPVDFAEFIFPNRSEILFDSVVSGIYRNRHQSYCNALNYSSYIQR
mgnify:CR=1 FL=1